MQNDISDENIETFISDFSEKIKGSGGTVLNVDKQGRKSLKYPIKKQAKGFYCFIQYQGDDTCLKETARFLKFNENVLRHTNIRITEEETAEISSRASVDPPSEEKPAPETDQVTAEPAGDTPDIQNKEDSHTQ